MVQRPKDEDSEMSDADGDIYEDEQDYGDDEYKPGSIIRVHMKDFVTYTDATFYPGPFLNMVIGPNGTGKSTLVCAICLGLGYMPSVGCAFPKRPIHAEFARCWAGPRM